MVELGLWVRLRHAEPIRNQKKKKKKEEEEPIGNQK
jgi:hypothetical protein